MPLELIVFIEKKKNRLKIKMFQFLRAYSKKMSQPSEIPPK